MLLTTSINQEGDQHPLLEIELFECGSGPECF